MNQGHRTPEGDPNYLAISQEEEGGGLTLYQDENTDTKERHIALHTSQGEEGGRGVSLCMEAREINTRRGGRGRAFCTQRTHLSHSESKG